MRARRGLLWAVAIVSASGCADEAAPSPIEDPCVGERRCVVRDRALGSGGTDGASFARRPTTGLVVGDDLVLGSFEGIEAVPVAGGSPRPILSPADRAWSSAPLLHPHREGFVGIVREGVLIVPSTGLPTIAAPLASIARPGSDAVPTFAGLVGDRLLALVVLSGLDDLTTKVVVARDLRTDEEILSPPITDRCTYAPAAVHDGSVVTICARANGACATTTMTSCALRRLSLDGAIEDLALPPDREDIRLLGVVAGQAIVVAREPGEPSRRALWRVPLDGAGASLLGGIAASDLDGDLALRSIPGSADVLVTGGSHDLRLAGADLAPIGRVPVVGDPAIAVSSREAFHVVVAGDADRGLRFSIVATPLPAP